MNDEIFKFLDEEIRYAQLEGSSYRVKRLKAIKGYLVAAKSMRDDFVRNKGRSEYPTVPDFIDRFDLECARVSP